MDAFTLSQKGARTRDQRRGLGLIALADIDADQRGFYRNVDAQACDERLDNDQARHQLPELIAIASEDGEVIIMQDGKLGARLIAATDRATYKLISPSHAEFPSAQDSLASDADGWEGLA
jgi:antitoxin (DNA-binding transcriptional repressor) of toxin-antitoxin stability system